MLGRWMGAQPDNVRLLHFYSVKRRTYVVLLAANNGNILPQILQKLGRQHNVRRNGRQ
jgi:hypothetical protein